MSNLVLLASADADSLSNYANTVEAGVDMQTIADHLGAIETDFLRTHFGDRKVPIWGVWAGKSGGQVGKWAKLRDGDLAVFSRTNGVRAHARVVLPFRSPGLASALWADKQTDDGPMPYELMFALDEVTNIDLDASTLNRTLGYAPNASIRGITVVPLERSAAAQGLITGLPQPSLARPQPLRIGVESSHTAAYPVRGNSDTVQATRREAGLVKAYVAWLQACGRDACRHRVPLPEGGSLFTDVFDINRGEVVEAKADNSRNNIRTALGQVLDYAHLISETRSRAVLVPDRPRDDLIALLSAYDVATVWQEGSGFRRIDP